MNILEGGRKYYLDYHKNVLIGCLVVALHVWFICLITSCIDRNGGNAVITLLPNIALYAWIILIILLCIALSFVFSKLFMSYSGSVLSIWIANW